MVKYIFFNIKNKRLAKYQIVKYVSIRPKWKKKSKIEKKTISPYGTIHYKMKRTIYNYFCPSEKFNMNE